MASREGSVDDVDERLDSSERACLRICSARVTRVVMVFGFKTDLGGWLDSAD